MANFVGLVYLVSLVHLVGCVCLVDLVSLVDLVGLVWRMEGRLARLGQGSTFKPACCR